MHVTPFAIEACCVGFLQAGVGTAPTTPQAVEEWAAETVARGFGHHPADASSTASRDGHLAGDG